MSSLPLSLPDWPRAFPYANANMPSALLRSCPEDFQVNEVLGFEPCGEGEHAFLHVRKRNLNTDDVVKQLARHAGIKLRDVGYAGLKDRNAVTTQWFSVWLPGKPDPDWSAIESESLQILCSQRHSRKLQRGALQGNHFVIVLRDVEFSGQLDRDDVEQQLQFIQKLGVPNYFGEQRFGRGGRNLVDAAAMFEGRRVKAKHLRSLYLSSARSFLFNEVLAARIRAANWNQLLPGEVLLLAGSRSFFVAEKIDEELLGRFETGDVLPSGPLWGRGALASQGKVLELEQTALADFALYRDGLERAGLKQERRALRLSVDAFQSQWLPEENGLQLAFSLPAGCYATSVLRELVQPRANP